MHNKITSEELLNRILCSKEEELQPIINAVTERFSELRPEWELMTLSIQGHDRESHIKALQDSIAFFSGSK